MRLHRLLAQAAQLGVQVEWGALGARRGDYCDDLRVIRLNTTLTRAQTIQTLSHELGHAIHRDRETSARIEARASRTGAGLAITVAEYIEAEALVGTHSGALAVELGVTASLIESWREWYARQGRDGDRTLTLEGI